MKVSCCSIFEAAEVTFSAMACCQGPACLENAGPLLGADFKFELELYRLVSLEDEAYSRGRIPSVLVWTPGSGNVTVW